MKSVSVFLLIAFLTIACQHSTAQSPDNIRINQLGYFPEGPKWAIAIGAGEASSFYILATGNRDTVFRGVLGPLLSSSNSSLQTRAINFTTLDKEGVYVISIPDVGESYPFRIGGRVLGTVVAASLKGYYYQRSGMALEESYAGRWSRPAGHPDTQVVVHPSAASDKRPAGFILSSPGGWYDAGDYNKYIVNSGITMGTLLDAYEDFSDYFDTLHTNIPSLRSSSGASVRVPDILNEVLYNLRWMLTMQDPNDGGVYHKCTNAAFDGMVMPDFTKAPRYVVQKGTAATLDFAAVMAQAGRILKKYSASLPGLSDSCLHAAGLAWQWAMQHPDVVYDQEALNRTYTPKVTTGGYGDRDFKDEFYWAAAELLVSTGDDHYRKTIEERIGDPMRLPNWGNVRMMGDYTLLHWEDRLGAKWKTILHPVRQKIMQMADEYMVHMDKSAFHTVMGKGPGDFIWGSNSVAANEGILLINAWFLTKDKKYVEGALSNLDYLLGRNATGYCFVTGVGSHSPMHPHHRPSVADGIEAPVPGLLVGGPNPGMQDRQHYEWTEPETAYTDKSAAYACNEIAINWNAPLVYLSGAMEALAGQIGY